MLVGQTVYVAGQNFLAGDEENSSGISRNLDVYLVLDSQQIDISFTWIANSGDGAAYKLDTWTGEQLGFYKTVLQNPSRTTVDLICRVWVGYRFDGGVAKNRIGEATRIYNIRSADEATIRILFVGFMADHSGVRRVLVLALLFMLAESIVLVVIGYGMYKVAAYAAMRQFITPKTAAMGFSMYYALMNLGGRLSSFAFLLRGDLAHPGSSHDPFRLPSRARPDDDHPLVHQRPEHPRPMWMIPMSRPVPNAALDDFNVVLPGVQHRVPPSAGPWGARIGSTSNPSIRPTSQQHNEN